MNDGLDEELNSIRHYLTVDLAFGRRMSKGLVNQLIQLHLDSREDDVVLMEIDCLDKGISTSTKGPYPFNKQPLLQPFWHKHFSLN